MLLALVYSFLVLCHSWGLDGFPVYRVKPIETIVLFPPVKRTIIANFLEVLLTEDGVVDLNSGRYCFSHD